MGKKLLLITFSDNADHQDVMIGMYEQLLNQKELETFLMIIKKPKVPFQMDEHVWFIDCPKRPGITKQTFNFYLLCKTIRKIRKENFDAIYFESLHVWNVPIMLFKSPKTMIFHVIHEVIPHEGDRQVKLVHLMNKVICKLSDIIVLHNHKYINTLSNTYHVNLQRIREIDCWRRYPAYTDPKYSKHFLFFGRINPYKGIDYLFKVIKQCPTLHFNIVGRVDPESVPVIDKLRKFVNVSVTDGYVTDHQMEAAFIDADWIILPYKSASQSGVIMDAYKYSRPVIAFNVGAIGEQIKNGKSGYLITPKDINSFSQKLNELSKMSDDKYAVMSRNAYELGRNKYAAEGAVIPFLQIISKSRF